LQLKYSWRIAATHRQQLPRILPSCIASACRRVYVTQALTEVTYGNEDTDGSRGTRHFFERLRRRGAATRTMLEQAAARSWGATVSEVQAIGGDALVADSDGCRGVRLEFALSRQAPG
jgi:isoquinoline 1-oxidoreductase subunit beta